MSRGGSHKDRFLEATESGNIASWNSWRRKNPGVAPRLRAVEAPHRNLKGINLSDALLHDADLSFCDLTRANLEGARLAEAKLRNACLYRVRARGARADGIRARGADFTHAELQEAKLRNACLRHANMWNAKLGGAWLHGADLTCARLDHADLSSARLMGCTLDSAVLFFTNLRGADLSEAFVFDAFTREVKVDEETVQKRLIIRRTEKSPSVELRGDDIRVASFVWSFLDDSSIRAAMQAGAGSYVLILGRFTARRRRVLKALQKALEHEGRIAKLFDFPGPDERGMIEVVRFMAGLSQFIVADITDPSSVALELQMIAPNLVVPIVPIIQANKRVFPMFLDLRQNYPWVLQPLKYKDAEDLVRRLDERVLEPVADKLRELQQRRLLSSEPL